MQADIWSTRPCLEVCEAHGSACAIISFLFAASPVWFSLTASRGTQGTHMLFPFYYLDVQIDDS